MIIKQFESEDEKGDISFFGSEMQAALWDEHSLTCFLKSVLRQPRQFNLATGGAGGGFIMSGKWRQ